MKIETKQKNKNKKGSGLWTEVDREKESASASAKMYHVLLLFSDGRKEEGRKEGRHGSIPNAPVVLLTLHLHIHFYSLSFFSLTNTLPTSPILYLS